MQRGRLLELGKILGLLLNVGVTCAAFAAAPSHATAPSQVTQPVTASPSTSSPSTSSPAISSPTPTDAPPTDTTNTDPSTTDAPTTDAPSEHASVSLSRTGPDGKQRLITVIRTGDSDDTGIFAICSPTAADAPSTPTVFVTSESTAGGIELRVDKNTIRAPLAIITKQASPEISNTATSGPDGPTDGHIEVSAGTARYLDSVPAGKTDRLSLCAVEATPKPTPGTVKVTQGRTTLQGTALVYDESDGIARITGPITFERASQQEAQGSQHTQGNTLTGSSDSIEVNIDHETTTLVGHVTLRSGGRVSTAQRVDYDDQANIATLHGTPQQPAEVQDKGSTIQARQIRYNLSTGRVSAQDIMGQFEVEEGTDAQPK